MSGEDNAELVETNRRLVSEALQDAETRLQNARTNMVAAKVAQEQLIQFELVVDSLRLFREQFDSRIVQGTL